MSIAQLLHRPEAYRASVYRQRAAGTGSQYEQVRAWDLVADNVPIEIQERSGSVQPQPIGEHADAKYWVCVNHGTDFKEGYGVLVTGGGDQSFHGTRLLVQSAHSWGPRGGIQGTATLSDDDFGGESQESAP